MTTGIYTTKWFLQCFIDRVSIWDIYTPQSKHYQIFLCISTLGCEFKLIRIPRYIVMLLYHKTTS